MLNRLGDDQFLKKFKDWILLVIAVFGLMGYFSSALRIPVRIEAAEKTIESHMVKYEPLVDSHVTKFEVMKEVLDSVRVSVNEIRNDVKKMERRGR